MQGLSHQDRLNDRVGLIDACADVGTTIIYATPSARYGDPRAKLLTGRAWEAAKGPALNALSLPEDPEELLLEHTAALDNAWLGMADSLTAGTIAHVGSDWRLHAEKIDAIPDPPSLVDLRRRLEAMLPRVDLPELILEVMGWLPAFAEAFTGLSGGPTRMRDLDVTIAAALTAHALNVGYVPVVSESVAALKRSGSVTLRRTICALRPTRSRTPL